MLINIRDEKSGDPLSKLVLVDVLHDIKRLKRKTDIIGEYGSNDTFAILLPETGEEGCKCFLDRIEKELSVNPHAPQLYEEQKTDSLFERTLEGDLCKLQISNLLQTVSMSKLTGRLQINSLNDQAQVFFNEGTAVHCWLKSAQGEAAIVQLMGWEEGKFCFFPEPKTDIITIHKRLESLIREGAQFVDQFKSLNLKGLSFDAIITCRHESLTEEEFDNLLISGTGISNNDQKKFYLCIDNRSTLLEIIRRQQLSQIQWVPIVYNLIKCGLIDFVKSEAYLKSTPNDKSMLTHWNQIKSSEKVINRGIKLQAAWSTIGWRCDTLSRMIGSVETAMVKIRLEGKARGSFNNLFPAQSPPEKNIDLRPVYELVDKLTANQYGIFSYPTLVSFIEHEFNRAKRNKQALYVLRLTVSGGETDNQDVIALRQALAMLVSRIGALQWRNYLLAHYGGNSLLILLPKATAEELQKFANQIESSVPELSPLKENSRYNLKAGVCFVGMDKNDANVLLITPLGDASN